MKPDIRFSIISAVRNGQAGIERLAHSLFSQSWKDWEWLVQDGFSTDKTLPLLYAMGDDRINLASEPDSGVYDAWNKALARAGGDWILFLGADDYLVDIHVLARAARELAGQDHSVQFAQAGLHVGRGGKVRETLARSKAEVFRFMISGMPLLTPAAFFRADLFATPDQDAGQGLPRHFDPSYRIAGDFAFVSSRLHPGNMALLSFVSTYMELGGLSSSLKHRALLGEERKRVLSEEIKPRAANIVQYCIDSYDDSGSALKP